MPRAFCKRNRAVVRTTGPGCVRLHRAWLALFSLERLFRGNFRVERCGSPTLSVQTADEEGPLNVTLTQNRSPHFKGCPHEDSQNHPIDFRGLDAGVCGWRVGAELRRVWHL